MSGPHHHSAHDGTFGHQRLRPVGVRTLGMAILLTGGYAVVELVGGILSGSLALVSDAGHMATDATALLIALVAQVVARRPATATHTYGYGRIEALAAFVNGLVLLALTGWIVFEAFARLRSPTSIDSTTLLVVAGIGLLVNLSVAWVLSRDRHDLNTRAALAHVWGDLLGSLAALLAGVAILFGAPFWVDSLLSLLICILIVRSALAVCRAALFVLMERVPEHLDLMKIYSAMVAVSGVRGVHNLHVWELAPGQVALTAHLDLSDLQQWPSVLAQTVALLTELGVDHITLQPEIVANSVRPNPDKKKVQ